MARQEKQLKTTTIHIEQPEAFVCADVLKRIEALEKAVLALTRQSYYGDDTHSI
jgi:hypothetical protein